MIRAASFPVTVMEFDLKKTTNSHGQPIEKEKKNRFPSKVYRTVLPAVTQSYSNEIKGLNEYFIVYNK